MKSLGKGTVPRSGEAIHICGALRAKEILEDTKKPKDLANITITDGGYELEVSKGRHELDLGLDLSEAEISVATKKPCPDDISFCYLELKDQRGSRVNLDLGLKVARRIREKLNRYFAKEGPKQVWRLAHIEDIWKKNAEEHEASLRKAKKEFMAFVEKERAREARLA